MYVHIAQNNTQRSANCFFDHAFITHKYFYYFPLSCKAQILCPKMERKKQKLIEFVCTINVSNIWKCTRNMHKQRQFNKSLFTPLHSECVFALIFWYKHNDKHYLQTDFVLLRKMLLHSVITQRSRINRVKSSVIKYVIGLHIYLERTMIYKW